MPIQRVHKYNNQGFLVDFGSSPQRYFSSKIVSSYSTDTYISKWYPMLFRFFLPPNPILSDFRTCSYFYDIWFWPRTACMFPSMNLLHGSMQNNCTWQEDTWPSRFKEKPRQKLKARQVDPFIIEGYSSASLCKGLVLGSCLMHIRVRIYHALNKRFDKTM